MKMSKYFLLVLTLFCAASTYAQNQSNNLSQENSFDIRRTIRFQPESKAEMVILEIGNGVKSFIINIDGRISEGSLMVEIRTPQDVIQGEFKINTQLSANYEEEVMARINKNIKNPEPGKWKVQLKPSAAKGMVMIRTETDFL